MLSFDKKSWSLCIIFALIITIYDYNNRLSLLPTPSTVTLTDSEPDFVVNQQLDSHEKQKILLLFSQYDLPPPLVIGPQKNTSKLKESVNLIAQQQQIGSLKKLFIGDFVYSAMGIFKSKKINTKANESLFAVLIQKDVNNNVTKEIKVTLNQLLPPYQVSNISENTIEFTAGERLIKLSVFK